MSHENLSKEIFVESNETVYPENFGGYIFVAVVDTLPTIGGKAIVSVKIIVCFYCLQASKVYWGNDHTPPPPMSATDLLSARFSVKI